jgi:hypothetical protein
MQASKQSRGWTALMAGVVLLAGCGRKDAQPATNPPAREIQLAPTGNAQPQLNDAPVASQPAAAPARAPRKQQRAARRAVVEAPAPPPEPTVVVTPLNPPPSAAAPPPAEVPAAPPVGIVETGRMLTVHPAIRVCTNTQKVGDRVSALLGNDVQGSNGLIIPAGSAVTLRVAESVRSENSKDNMRLAFDVVSVRIGNESYEVDGRVTTATPLEKVRAQSTGDQAKKVGAGAVIGAIAGQLLGHNTRSTVVGGAVGAAAGAAVASGTADYNGCLPTSGALTITLNRPLRIRVAAE